MNSSHKKYLECIRQYIPQERIYTDDLRCLAWGTDAGFYRKLPQMVIRSASEEEVSRLLRDASALGIPVTFRAAFRRIDFGHEPIGTPQATIAFEITPQPLFHKNFELLTQQLQSAL